METTNAAENTEKTKKSSNSSTTMIGNIKQAMVGNISSIGNTLKRMHADTASPSNAKRQKTMTAHCDELRDEASQDKLANLADSSALLQVTCAL